MGHLRRNRRAGFTIIELLTVIAVIALMTALLAGASYRFVVGARESATVTTIVKVNGIIQDRVRAFQEFDFSDSAVAYTNFLNANLNSNDQISTGLGEVLFRKRRFKNAFPQAFADLDSSQASRFFPSVTGALPGSLPIKYDPKYECGIVLYALLLKGETFGSPTPGDDTFAGAEVRNGDETGNLPCLVDSWGEPLRFYRWPTRLIRCGEQNFTGKTTPAGYFDDYNQNGIQDLPGWVDPSTGNATFSPAIRPCQAFPALTPAALLISNLPPFNLSLPLTAGNYVLGPDGARGNANFSTASPPFNTPPWNTLGIPDSDDPEPLNTDPDDPTLKLSAWLFDTNISASNQVLRRSNFVAQFHDFYTFQTPLIVSGGPDKKLGLFEPTDIPNHGYLAAPKFPTSGTTIGSALVQDLYDNITNLNQRAGGK